MLILHDYLPSQNGWKVRTLLELLSIPYRIEPVAIFSGKQRSDAFLTKNPAGAVPVLELDDGRTIAESNAILFYLAEGTPYLPEDPYSRAKILQWMFFEQYYVEPTIGSLRFWTLTGRLDMNAALAPGKREGGYRALRALDSALGGQDFLVSGHLTIADISIYAYGNLAGDAGFALDDFPSVVAYFSRVTQALGDAPPVHAYGPEATLK